MDSMKKETMEKLMALPKASQDKVWKLAMDRLKAEKLQKSVPAQVKQSKK
jgi:hypothetical protein